MKKNLIMQIDQAIEKSMDDLKMDLIKLIGIKSVKGEPLPGAPFGADPRAVLDAVLDMGKQEGFYTTEHTEGVISLSLKEGQPDLGIWLHGDVVPEGAGWDYDPYQATEYKGCIIGRGATDNKGQMAALFLLLVDDVYTTGETARECAKTLREGGAISVSFLCFAQGE